MYDRSLFKFNNGAELLLSSIVYVGAFNSHEYRIHTVGGHVITCDNKDTPRDDLITAWKRSMIRSARKE